MTDLDVDLHIVLTDRIGGLQHRYRPAECVGDSHGAMLTYASAAVADAWRLAGSATAAADAPRGPRSPKPPKHPADLRHMRLRVTPSPALMGDLKELLGPGCLGS
jgi:hypothetical protein